MSLTQRMPALAHPEFRIYILGGFVSNVGSMVQNVAIMYHVFALTNSSFAVGLMGLVRVVPLLIFSLLGGVIADQYDRRTVMFCTQGGMALVALGLFAMEMTHSTSLVLLYGFVALGAVARALDGPARQPLVASLVPPKDLPNAFSLNGISWRLSDVSGPIIAGFMLTIRNVGPMSGLAFCYLFNFITFFAVLYAVYLLAPRPSALQAHERVRTIRQTLTFIRDGLAFVRRAPVVRSAMWIDFWGTFFSGAEALLPAFAISILGVGKTGYGILAASTGMGALVAAGVLALLPTIHRQGRWVIGMILLYGFSTILFGISPNLPLACFFLAVAGAADMISTVLRQTIRQLQTPDGMRGRMTATAGLFHISGPQLGDFEAGAVARFTGERLAIVIGGAACMLVTSLWLRGPGLKDYEHEDISVDPSHNL